jgi:hypothetical protein
MLPGSMTPANAAPAPGPVAGAPGSERRRSFHLGIWNGALYQWGEGFVDANTVIPVFLSKLTSSNALIGLGAALPDIGWFLPQFATVPLLSRRARSIGLYRLAAVLRGLAFALLALLIVPLADHPAALLATFLACYATYSFGGGLAAVPFMEVVGKTVPQERLGAYWSLRLFWGGLLVAGAGLFVRQLLRGGTDPPRFALLFGVACVLVSLGYGLFSIIREPASPPRPEAGGPLGMLRQGLGMLAHDAHFRHLLVARATLSVWFAAAPFMVLFAVHELGGGPRAAGTFLLARMTGFVLSNLLWHRVSSRHGDRVLMRIGAAACSALPLAAAAVAIASPWGLGWLPAGAAVVALEAVVCLGGAGQSAMTVGYSSLMLLLAPPGRRQAFVGLINTFLGPIMLLPMLGGALVDWINAPVLFVLCAGAGLVGVRAAAKLRDSRGLPPEVPLPGGAGWADGDQPGGHG